LAFLRELCLWELSLLPLLFLHKILSAVEPQEIKQNWFYSPFTIFVKLSIKHVQTKIH
jgi:hypothetical protein